MYLRLVITASKHRDENIKMERNPSTNQTVIGLYQIPAPVLTPAEIRPFSQIRLKSGTGQNLDQISGFEKSAMLPDKAPRPILLKYNSK